MHSEYLVDMKRDMFESGFHLVCIQFCNLHCTAVSLLWLQNKTHGYGWPNAYYSNSMHIWHMHGVKTLGHIYAYCIFKYKCSENDTLENCCDHLQNLHNDHSRENSPWLFCLHVDSSLEFREDRWRAYSNMECFVEVTETPLPIDMHVCITYHTSISDHYR